MSILSHSELHPDLQIFFRNGLNTLEYDFLEQDAKELWSYPESFLLRYSSGGLHGSVNERIYKDTLESAIYWIDFKNMYPNLIIKYDLFPKIFNNDQKKYFKELVIKRNEPGFQQLKAFTNNFYGSILAKTSPYYDPKIGRSICYHGQALLTILLGRLLKGTSARIINVNTDGLIFMLPKKKN